MPVLVPATCRLYRRRGAFFSDATRERDLCLADGGVVPSAPLADFDADRAFRLRTGLASVSESSSAGAGAGDVAAGATFAVGLRPKPTALAIVERCSE